MLLYTRKVMRQGRPEQVIDTNTIDSSMFTHGRNLWLRSGAAAPVIYYWDTYQKEFVTKEVFDANREIRARLNRQKHSLTPFGKLARKKRLQEEGSLPPLTLGWVGP